MQWLQHTHMQVNVVEQAALEYSHAWVIMLTYVQ